MSLLRFITCGSVDDGKSTLIGRLLYDTRQLHADQLATLAADSKHRGSELDLSLLVDGLLAEREQGITIDVAYRYFATEARTFIVADTPGHEQYTRNMVTGASTADAAVILLDARKGMLRQTRRHSHIVSLLGIRRVVLAVNKIDLVGYDQKTFEDIAAEYRTFATGIGIDEVACVPVSALDGSNVVTPATTMPWYDGPTLLDWLERVDAEDLRRDAAFRMIVQWVNRPGPDFRGLSGSILGGTVRVGDTVRVYPGEQRTTIERLVTFDGDLDEAGAGQSVTAVLADDLDVSRGAVLTGGDDPSVADACQADLIWMGEQEMLPGRRYLAKIGARTVGLTVEAPRHRVDVDTGAHLAAKTLHLNEIGVANVHFDQPIAMDPYRDNRDLGGFIIIDRLTNATVGAGLVRFALRRATNLRWQDLTVDKTKRAQLNGHRGCVVWFTGLSGAGKSTVANLVEQRLHAQGRHTFILDGDNVRHGLNKDLGFTDADRVENVRRVGEVAGLMVDAGLIVLVSFISPFRAERSLARGIVAADEFCEVHVDASLTVAESRDTKGLYAKARRGELPNFTGIDSPYERPQDPEVRVDTGACSAEEAADAVLAKLAELGVC
ncbi:adenylyl-sulfate kinase [Actinophytocola xinjiangensis]|uniref:Multifunctional fusion protein n=1 Tax=Actinophytocola xinjiangensis TaxID=485602 RepID=A0A7Z0WQP4_9PSEU|nr:sulfate adenylyltransferase subunit CysN [Actinophytocola xinjiangensis]OLF13083.1 adenylyl-sulfate kinase [Actinophytocola xinjiangensis]